MSAAAAAAAINPTILRMGTERSPRQLSPPGKIAAASLPALLERPRLPPPAQPSVPVAPIGQNAEDGSGAADVLRLMDALRLPVEADLYAYLLRECAARSDADDGRRVHDHIRRNAGRLLRGPAGTLLMNRLLLTYAAAGELQRAREVFDGMPVPARNPVSWATVIAGLSAAGDHAGSLRLFVEMLREQSLAGGSGSRPAVALLNVVVAAVLRGCGETRNDELGSCIHGLLLKMGLDCLGSSRVRRYGRGDDGRTVSGPMRARCDQRRRRRP